MASPRKRAVMVAISGTEKMLSIAPYHLKAYAYMDGRIKEAWDISAVQHEFFHPLQPTSAAMCSEIVQQVVRHDPDLVGFCCYQWSEPLLQRIAKTLREQAPRARLVWGGPQISRARLVDGELDDVALDFAVFGEGEQSFSELLQALTAAEPEIDHIEGLAYRKGPGSGLVVNEARPRF